MPTAEVLCTHQGVSQSRGKSICPAQGSPVLVINNPNLKCGYCFQRIHQLEKQKKHAELFLSDTIHFFCPEASHTCHVCVCARTRIRLCYTYRSQRTSMSSSITFHVTIFFYFVVCVCYTCLCGCVNVCLQVYMLFLHDPSTIFSGILSLNQKPTDLDCSVCELCISTCLYCPPHLLVPWWRMPPHLTFVCGF